MQRRGRWLTITAAAALVLGALPSHGAVSAPPLDACPTADGEYALDSVETVEDLLVGVWIRCDGGPFPGSQLDDVGLEVTDDLGFHRLYDVDGTVVRARGVLQEGDVAVLDLTEMNGPGSYQVDWQFLGGGTRPEFPFFAASPDMMRLDSSGATYVRDRTATPVDGAIPGLGGTCGLLDDQVAIGPGELEEAVVGVWLRCDGPPVMGAEEAEAGIELTADGAAHRLYRQGEGLVRVVGPGHSGTWTIVDDVQLDIDVLGSGTFIYQPLLFDQPQRTVRLLGMTGPTDLRRWDGYAPLTGPVPVDVACGGLADPITPASPEEAIGLFVGVWIPCVGDAGPDGQAAMEIAADGHFYRVYRSADGSLVRADGVGQEGLWSLSGDAGGGRYGFGFGLSGAGGFGVQPAFYGSPTISMWIGAGSWIFPAGAYQRWAGDPPTLGPPRGPISPCGHLRDVVALDWPEEAQARLIGEWTLCDAHSVHGAPLTGEAGIEFGGDGSFHLLIRGSDGTVSSGVGSDRAGTWTLSGDILVLTFGGGQSVELRPVFLDDPDSVSFRVNRFGTDYVRAAPPVLPPTGRDPRGIAGAAAALIAAGGVAVAIAGAHRRRSFEAGA